MYGTIQSSLENRFRSKHNSLIKYHTIVRDQYAVQESTDFFFFLSPLCGSQNEHFPFGFKLCASLSHLTRQVKNKYYF